MARLKRFLGTVLTLGVVFGAGYYFEEIRQTFNAITEDVAAPRTRAPDIRTEFLEAKARFLDGKADILDGQYKNAGDALESALHHLHNTTTMKGAAVSRELLDGAMDSIARLQRSLAEGREIAAGTLHDAQDKLNALLDDAG